ncbi:MAG: TPM domain-containing protein [Burkholderiales bacterium]
MIRKWLAVLSLLCLAAGLARAEVAVPPLHARVTDLTATLSSDQTRQLEQKLAAFEAKKGSQIALLMVPTTQPETVEQYAIRVAETWKLGRKGIDDGVLLLVAKNDRALRIEVGYGLEGALNDATAKRIVSDIIIPHFKHGDFYAGVDAGVSRIMAVIEGEPLPAPRGGASGIRGSDFMHFLIPALLLFVFLDRVMRTLFGRLFGSLTLSVLGGFVVWFFSGIVLIALIAGLMLFVFGLFVNTRGGYSGGWPAGGYGSSGGGSFGGGGFSGGGGGFGGGGASGSW